jgi:NADPH:quinone reductase-like Zn-dependent oxidoreductase
LQELGASEIVTEVDELQGDFELILESVGGDSLAAAVKHIAQGGTIVVFGNSSTQPTPISFYDLAAHAGARIQSFVSYLSGPPESFAKDLALLARLVGDGKLHPSIGVEGDWRELGEHLKSLADRQVKGKMIFTLDK